MLYRALADIVLIVHLAFILAVVFGGFAVLRWRRLAWIHVPIFVYGALVELTGIVCPLTPLEVWLRELGGEAGYRGGFIDHYIVSAIYPSGLTRGLQIALGFAVLLINVIVYVAYFRGREDARGHH